MPLTKLNATFGLTGTLPAVSGANLTGISAGKILQIQQTYHDQGSSNVGTNSTSFVDITGMTDTITASATSSKIFGIVVLNGHAVQNTAINSICTMQRGIGGSFTDMGSGNYGLAHNYHTTFGTTCFTFLDSPNSTAELTYKLQAKCDNSSYTAYIMRGNSRNSITLFEIEG